jgi:hypothetical protein
MYEGLEKVANLIPSLAKNAYTPAGQEGSLSAEPGKFSLYLYCTKATASCHGSLQTDENVLC